MWQRIGRMEKDLRTISPSLVEDRQSVVELAPKALEERKITLTPIMLNI